MIGGYQNGHAFFGQNDRTPFGQNGHTLNGQNGYRVSSTEMSRRGYQNGHIAVGKKATITLCWIS